MLTIENNKHSIYLDDEKTKILATEIANSISSSFGKRYKKMFDMDNGYLTYDNTQELEQLIDRDKYKEILYFLYGIKYHGSLSKINCELFQSLLNKQDKPILNEFKKLIDECVENDEYLRWY